MKNLLGGLRQIPVLKQFTLLKSTAVWNKVNVFPGAPVQMEERLEEFIMRTESPRHFVLLNYGLWGPWLEVLPPLYAAPIWGGLRHIRISGGPTSGRFIAWTVDPAHFCFKLEWNGSPPVPDGVRAIELMSPFYRLHVLCDELNAAGVRMILVEGDTVHIDVAEGYWHQLWMRLPSVEELWLYPGTV
ncbi:hypothetical protein BC827DRAFT_1156395 [Russula dissimulans]|nr:hypothetical protein BC827DRAFT_1156395 [Russula dissimulans]